MKLVSVLVRVPVEEDVTARMVRDVLANQLALNPERFLSGGLVDWMKVQVCECADGPR